MSFIHIPHRVIHSYTHFRLGYWGLDKKKRGRRIYGHVGLKDKPTFLNMGSCENKLGKELLYRYLLVCYSSYV
jgi:hypothetical protein